MTKYNAKKTKLDGFTFDSQAEARRYQDLKLMHEAGEIHKLRVHPRYLLLDKFTVKGVKYRAIEYVGDFDAFSFPMLNLLRSML
jgi:hypothetical protein